MRSYTYLLIDFFTVAICFIFSFHPKINFSKHFGAFIKAAVLAALPFIAWDCWFAKTGVWWFNNDYLLGIYIINLPLEEWLFFICVPFSCLFTYHCLSRFFNFRWANAFNNIIVYVSCVILFVTALLYPHKTYTFVTVLTTGVLLLYLHFIVRAEWIGQASVIFIILMLGFFPVNGLLTGTGLTSPIVNYNSEKILNRRVLTIPLEDFVYGYCQFLLNVFLFNFFSIRRIGRKSLQLLQTQNSE